MKLSAFLTLVAGTLALAQDPTTCNTANKSRKGSDFVLTDQGNNKHLSPLATIFKKAGRQVNVSEVFDDGNHKMTGSASKKAWEDLPSFSDMDTTKWVPQGISSTADALEVGTYEDKDGWVVSWHRSDDKSVRVTFVNKASGSYRHALLVNPVAGDTFVEVPVHAGGVMWYGNTLWVVDTTHGIRVFDLSNIWQVESGDGVGKKTGGGYSAASYKYVIPQIRMYKWTSSFSFHFSYIALDRTTSPDSLLVGEYRADSNGPIRMVKWELDYTTRKLKADAKGVAKGSWAYCVGIERMQGAVSANSKIYISRSNGAKAGDLWGWVPGKTAHNNAGKLPTSPEDLSYDKRGNKLYGLTEAAGKRYIITLDAAGVKTS